MADSTRVSAEQAGVGDVPVVVAEVERKFDVDAGFVAPDLSGLPGVARVADPERHDLDATYFDTPDLRLVAHKITLRRRTGGDDAGWHLKLPRSDGDRNEVRVPLGRATATVPPALRQVIEVHARGAELIPAVRLATTRTVTRLLDPDGAVLAEVAQDEVTAAAPTVSGGDPVATCWREVEVELGGGDRALLAAVVDRVLQAGARPSPSASKLSRALGDRLPRPPGGLRSVLAEQGLRKDSAGAALLSYIAEQVAQLVASDPLVRAEEPDAVHQMRVACRRLRSVLATYRPLVDRAVTDPIRAELGWLGGALGQARDAEVTSDQLRALVEVEPPELVVGPVIDRIVGTLDTRRRAAHDAALVDLNGPRYFDLLDSLDRLLADPPLTEPAHGRTDDVVLRWVLRTWKRTRALVGQADAEPDQRRRDTLLHEVRKQAKRARYAGESLAPTHGKAANRWVDRMTAIQDVLGRHHDTVVIRDELCSLAAAAHLAGEDGFSYGRLHAHEQTRAADAQREFELVWAAANDARVLRWLR